MKKIIIFFIFVFAILVAPLIKVQATDTAQNVLVSCLDVYVIPDPFYSEILPYAGTLMTHEQRQYFDTHGLTNKFHIWQSTVDNNQYAHVAMLKNKVSGTTTYKFAPDKPVSILRLHQGNYECAIDQNNVTTCPDDSIPTVPTQGYGMGFQVLDKTKAAILPSADGLLSVPHVLSWTAAFLDQSFFGMQILAQMTPLDQTNAIGASLKLATFTAQTDTPDAATNCITVAWDPYGRVIDAKTLEPVQNVQITLSNREGTNRVQTVNPQNPLFRNPFKTVADGTFNFAVPAGTYYLSPQQTDFTFPADQVTLQQVIANLKQADPYGTYVDTTHLLSSTDEQIVEKEGVPERRDIIMTPNDQSYSGSSAVIQTKNTTLDGTSYVISGMVSHPKTIVRALINGVVKTQVQTDLSREYSLAVPQAVLLDGFDGEIFLEIQKLPLIGTVTTASATTTTNVALMPTSVSGFAMDKNGNVIPNATVEVVVTKLGNLTFASTRADADGFFVLDAKRIPTFPFVLRFTDPQKPSNPIVLAPKDFAQANKAYFAETKRNMYTPIDPAALAMGYKPNQDLVTALKQSFVRTAPLSNLNPTAAPTTVSSSTPTFSNIMPLILLFVFVVLLGLGGALVLLKRPTIRM